MPGLRRGGHARLQPLLAFDHQYVVNAGLKAGETLVVEGQERLQPGVAAAPQAWQRSAASAP